MTTKAELVTENKLLRELANENIGAGTNITGCIFHGSATDAQCEAVTEIAKALKHAAKALNGAPMLQIGGKHE